MFVQGKWKMKEPLLSTQDFLQTFVVLGWSQKKVRLEVHMDGHRRLGSQKNGADECSNDSNMKNDEWSKCIFINMRFPFPFPLQNGWARALYKMATSKCSGVIDGNWEGDTMRRQWFAVIMMCVFQWWFWMRKMMYCMSLYIITAYHLYEI